MACTRSLLSPFATGSSSRVALQRRALAVSSPRALRQPDEWSYPSAKGDNRPRRPFLNPDVSETIPNEVARRAGLVRVLFLEEASQSFKDLASGRALAA